MNLSSVITQARQRWADAPDLPVYTAGRLTAVLTRPLLLFLTNNYLGQRAAQGLAIVFLANVLGISAIAADPYRRFYARHFGAGRRVNGYPFLLYLGSSVLLVTVGIGVVIAISLSLSRSPALAIAAMLYFVSEKLADEILRYRLFERRFEAWGWSNIARGFLQLSAFLLVLSYGRASSLWLPVLAFSAGNMIVFVPQLPPELWRLLRSIHLLGWIMRRAVNALIRDGMLWVLALLTSGLSYLDRSLAAIVAPGMLPQFMLASMCLASVQLMIDFFYVSRHRRAYLEGKITVAGMARSLEFPVVLGAGTIVGLAACVTTLHFSHRGGELPVSYIAAICLIQVSVALIAGIREIPYWQGSIDRLVAVEAGFYLIFSTVVAATWWLRLPPTEIFFGAGACVVLRLAAYTQLSAMSVRPRSVERRLPSAVAIPRTAPGYSD